jgi:site-specific recombinase XerD
MKESFYNEINNFIDYLKGVGYSESTINGYYFGLKDFFNYLKDRGKTPIKFNNQDVIDFKNSINNNFSPQTINTKIYAIKRYVEYLNKEKNISIDWKVNINKVKSKKDLIPVKNIDKLLNYVDKITKKSIIRERDKLIIKMLYFTGIKTKEMLKIKNGDIINNTLIIRNKSIILNKDLAKDIDRYIKNAKIKKTNFIFFNYSPANSKKRKIEVNNKPLTEKAVQDIFNKYRPIINNKLSIIDLRNSYLNNTKNQHTKLTFNNINNHITINTKDDYLKILLKN